MRIPPNHARGTPAARIARIMPVGSRMATSLGSRPGRLRANELRDNSRLNLRHIRKFNGVSQGVRSDGARRRNTERAGFPARLDVPRLCRVLGKFEPGRNQVGALAQASGFPFEEGHAHRPRRRTPVQ